ncbi:MAG: autotransporter outer membrane beta-barrel domain-containing protein [Rhodospirillaceae bacterium]|nr:autotransporter outer membrane beta-barrel domain-containing protein [Rhodospirillaceae bacterium]MYH38095.1 autotransporter outer membrane beta-barrel domain-containing protein [Rhodospirillaceae bacterium]MYK15403.1 autotransporter outer membrane beta-barrel domain-containing protein [Rhodospirillaceae bacterium]
MSRKEQTAVLSALGGVNKGSPASATITIRNDDTVGSDDNGSAVAGALVLEGWLGRFGRTVAQQALDGIAARISVGRTPGVRSPSVRLPSGRARPAERWRNTPAGVEIGQGLGAGTDLGQSRLRPTGPGRTMTGHDLLLGSRFSVTGERDASGGTTALWGRASAGRFDGRARFDGGGALSLDGNVLTAMLGADYARGKWLLGLALVQSAGEGDYTVSAPAGVSGKVRASLTAAIPYAHLRAGEGLVLWAAAGLGQGRVRQAPGSGSGGRRAMKADTGWAMGAAGLRGDLLRRAASGKRTGPALALVSDALWARTTSDKVTGIAASESDVTRLRLGLEGSWLVALEDGGSLTPKLELGARHDGDDAETGFGVGRRPATGPRSGRSGPPAAGLAPASPRSRLRVRTPARTGPRSAAPRRPVPP